MRRDQTGAGRRDDRGPRMVPDQSADLVGVGHQIVRGMPHRASVVVLGRHPGPSWVSAILLGVEEGVAPPGGGPP
ncbi:hypothetical protein [Ornithinimicrobium kibberense]|uniref:hypothetical protein n=1 Tax=Ornithinimicrobium kibberense TaxID=282060 RepID=UPI003614A6FE